MSASSGSQVKATIIRSNKEDNKRSEKTFAVGADKEDNSGSHLNSLRNCVNRLETQLNQYLTQIIDDDSEAAGDQSGTASALADSRLFADSDEPPKRSSARGMANTDTDSRDIGRQSMEPKRKKCKK